MMIHQEKIAPSLAPLSEDEHMKLITDTIARKDHSIKGLVARIAIIIRDIQH
jgi:hypothetical protein